MSKYHLTSVIEGNGYWNLNLRMIYGSPTADSSRKTAGSGRGWHPDGNDTTIIVLMLIDKRWKTAVCIRRMFQEEDISSNHSLVICKLKSRLKRTLRQQRHEPRRNIDALSNATVRAAFKDKVEQILTDLPEMPAELNDIIQWMKDATQQAARNLTSSV
jgi:hypothetical protein